MIKRIFIIASVSTATLLLAAVVIAVFFLKTSPGQRLLVDIAEKQIGAATNSTVKIEKLSGNLPSDLFVENVTFASDEENDQPWLKLKTLHLSWQPLALLRKRLAISDIVLTGVYLNSAPPAPEKPNNAPKGFEIPTALPFVSVGFLSFTDIYIGDALIAQPAHMSGTGSLNVGGRDISLAVELAARTPASDRTSDDIQLSINRDGTSNRLTVTMALSSTQTGVIARLANTDGPVTITAHGAAPVTDFAMAFTGAVGNIGAFDGTLTGDLEKRDAIDLDTVLTLGDSLHAIRDQLGATIDIDSTMQSNKDGITIIVDGLETEIATLTGRLAWQNRHDTLKTAALDARVLLSNAASRTLQSLFGPSTTITATLGHHQDHYALTGAINSPQWRITLADGKTDMRTALTGALRAEWDENQYGPALMQTGGAVKTTLAVQRDTYLKLEGINASLAPEGAATGTVSIDLVSDALAATLDIQAPEKTLNTVYPSINFTTDLSAKVSVTGVLDNFSVDVSGRTPAVTLSDGVFDAHALTASVSGLPTAPTGSFSLSAAQRGAQMQARIDTDTAGTIHLTDLKYTGPGFNLTGKGGIHAAEKRLSFAAAYTGMPGAEPVPGFPMVGAINANATIDDNVAIDIQAGGLRTPLFGIQNAAARARGPLSSVATSITADQIDWGDAIAFENFSSRATFAHTDSPQLVIEAFSVIANTIPVALTAPAQLSFGETFSVSGVRAVVDEDGTLALDANIAPDRWTAQVQSKNLPLLDSGSALDLDFSLDTDQEMLASGKVALRSTFVTDTEAPIAGRINWKDGQLRLRNSETTQALSLDVTIPARIIRRERLYLATEGAVDGTIFYDGQIEPLAAFLPVSLQALEGGLTADITLAGTLDAPSLEGVFDIQDAAYTDNITGFSLIGIAVDAAGAIGPAGTSLRFDALAQGPGQTQPSITAHGTVNIGDAARVDMKLSLNEAALAAEPVSSMLASGEISIAGALDALRIDGALVVDELNLETKVPPSTGLVAVDVVPANDDGVITSLDPATVNQDGFPLALTINADDRIFVRGRGMESEWQANISVTGDTAMPVVLGDLAIKTGYIDFADRRFDITRGKIIFDRLSPNNPTLDISAEVTANEVTAAIIIKGRGQQPTITLQSTPSLPNSDILAYILFGEPINELNSFEALQVAQALASLGAIGPFGGSGPLGSARKAVGLDLLSLDTGSSDAAASLTIGKYVADGLFVSATQDARGENGAVRVEYEISNSITVETEIRQDGDQTVSANWKRDF